MKTAEGQTRLYPKEPVQTIKEFIAEGFQSRQAAREEPRAKKRDQYARRKARKSAPAEPTLYPVEIICPHCQGKGIVTAKQENMHFENR
jgi:hypothetical protein